jgi:ankyrin repeat protein
MLRLFLRLSVMLGISLGPAAAMDAAMIEKFHDAVHIGDLKTVSAMLATDPALATSVDEDKFSPIHLLDMYFDEKILDLLLANGADINARNDEGVTLLHIITDPDAVSLLVQRGADIEARDVRGWTPLICQANNQDNGPDVVAALLANGANPNAKGSKGETALSFARGTGDEEFIKVMEEGGARD